MVNALGDRSVHRALLAGEPIDDLEERWRPALQEFRQLRRRHLRY